ncbi:hypothetical protein ACHAWF_008654 [Thalassiosira exigua]
MTLIFGAKSTTTTVDWDEDDDWEAISGTFSVLSVDSSMLADAFGGKDTEAYYDEKLKRWIFPQDFPDEALVPPPVIITPGPDVVTKPELSLASNDYLAALMAPPPRRGVPPKPLASPTAAPPTYAVFQPEVASEQTSADRCQEGDGWAFQNASKEAPKAHICNN